MIAIRNAVAAAALALMTCGATAAEQVKMASLLTPLKLSAYQPGTKPPPFNTEALDSSRVSLTGLRGKVVLVNFWASWCAECRPEMPVLDRLHRELGPQGFVVLGINAKEDVTAVRRYAKEMKLSFPLALDPQGTINHSYGVVAIPTTFLVARDGRAVAFGVGPRDWGGAPARAILAALLAEAPSSGGHP